MEKQKLSLNNTLKLARRASIYLAGGLVALGIVGCKDTNSQNQPKQKMFQYAQSGQIAEFPSYRIDEAIGLAAADFDGDGDIDLAYVSGYKNRGKVFLFKNDGRGNYAQSGQIAEFPSYRIDEAIGLAAADFDGDGDIDLAYVSGYKNRGKVFLFKNIATN